MTDISKIKIIINFQTVFHLCYTFFKNYLSPLLSLYFPSLSLSIVFLIGAFDSTVPKTLITEGIHIA